MHLPAGNVHEALNEPLVREPDRMVKMSIITPVPEATGWCHNLLYVIKADRSLRFCLDPQNMNKWIWVPKYYTPSNPDILLALAKGKYFMTLDCKSGYWAIKFDRSFLTTFNTPFGGYTFLRLAFGVVCSGNVFAEHVDRLFNRRNRMSA